MASIEQSPYPLAFPVTGTLPGSGNDLYQVTAGEINVLANARALTGMQKEAVINDNGKSWRMVCDEGPYLNGTDLAPFPLAFFTTGLVASIMSEFVALLSQNGISTKGIRLIQDNLYSMEGSAINGTMTGSALPVELVVEKDGEQDAEVLRQILIEAVAASPAVALLRSSLENSFSIQHGETSLPTCKVSDMKDSGKRPAGFDELEPDTSTAFPNNIIVKDSAAETVFGVEGGAGSSLTSEQKRVLHIRGVCSIREDGLKEIKVQLFKPIGSCFTFLSDDSTSFNGQERAPSGLAYLSAGIAFCYLTQMGRYSHIVKKPLEDYRIAQGTRFKLPGITGKTGTPPTCDPVKTHVFVLYPDDQEYVQTLVDMSEQTCFLHAACRNSVKIKIKG